MHTSFCVSICCVSSAHCSLCYTSSRHTPYRNPFPNKASLIVAEAQGCVRMMLWECGEINWTASHGSIWSLFVASLVCGICKSPEWEGCVCVFSGVGLWESEGANPECFTGEERTIQSPAPPEGPPHHYNSLHATSQDKDVVFSLCIKVPSHPPPCTHTNTLMLNTCFCTHTSRWCGDMIKSHAPIYSGPLTKQTSYSPH